MYVCEYYTAQLLICLLFCFFFSLWLTRLIRFSHTLLTATIIQCSACDETEMARHSWVIQERPRPRTKQRVGHCVKADAVHMASFCGVLMLYTWLVSPVAMCIAIWGRYTRLAWLANPNPNSSNPFIRLAVCIDTFLYETSQFRQIVTIQLNCITTSLCNCFSTISRWKQPN